MTTKAAFLDLNGTLTMPVRVNHLAEHTIIPSAIEAVRLLNQHGFVCPVVTVQTRIAKGYFSADEFAAWFGSVQARFDAEGAELRGPYVCPHRSRDNCACYKPQTHLYQHAAAEHGIAVERSVVIGDTVGDLRAAKALGCAGCLVRTGWGERALREHGAGQFADYIADDVLAAARWLTAHAAL